MVLCALYLGCQARHSLLPPSGAESLAYLEPSNHRDWQPNHTVVPRAKFNRDLVFIKNIRNCRYITQDDYVINHYDREFDLNKLTSVDFIVVPFKETPNLAHTMLSFGFDDEDYLAISVEARLEQNEVYSPVKGSMRHFELIYVVGDERDLVQLRTNYRKSDVYIYRANVPPEQVRELFVDMLKRANKLSDKPEFYDSITNNCTTNIVYHVNRVKPGLIPKDLRILLPGNSDQLAYDLGLIDKNISFNEVRRRAHANERAEIFANAPDFSQRIRR